MHANIIEDKGNISKKSNTHKEMYAQ